MTKGLSKMLFDQISKEIVSLVKKSIKDSKDKNKVLKVTAGDIENSLSQHLTKVSTFTSEISFKELSTPKSLFSVYIPLDISLAPFKRVNKDFVPSRTGQLKVATEAVEETFQKTKNNILLIGVPGAGKTTTLKYVCQKLLTDENFLKGVANYPLLIRLRENEIVSDEKIPLFFYILNLFGILIENINSSNPPTEQDIIGLNTIRKKAVIELLNKQKVLLVIDGVDEIGNDKIKDMVLNDINEISLTVSNSRFIVTTRKGDDVFHISNTQVFELAPLSDKQILKFSSQWFSNKDSGIFLKQLKKSSVYDSAKRPLTLSHLCAIFENEGRIPEKSRSIYRKIINLLLLEWNLENKISRPSKFTDFEPDRKKEFLENLAFELSIYFGKSQFSHEDLVKCYNNLYFKFNLRQSEIDKVVNEIQVHNGLIVQTGFDVYEFAHKSFQEYLAAEYIVKLPSLPFNINSLVHPNELALAVILSSDSSEYLKYVIQFMMDSNRCSVSFFNTLFTRLEIEKVDFLENPFLAAVILELYTILFKQACEGSVLDINLFREGAISRIGDLDSCFNILLSLDNIDLCFKQLSNHVSNKMEYKTIDCVTLPYLEIFSVGKRSTKHFILSPQFYKSIF